MNTRTGNQKGFTLITALFVLVVVSALGGYLVSLSTAQHLSSALSVRSEQAIYAAQSGLEWVMYRFNAGDDCGALPGSLTVEAFTVDIDGCTVQTVNEGGVSYPLYDVSLTASFGNYGDFDYVRRRVNAVMKGA